MCAVDWRVLEQVLEEEPDLIAAWVFGSAQEGQVRPEGDLDIGVLFASRPSLSVRAGLRAKLQQVLRIDAIDLVVLNDASPLLRFEALSGRPVFCRDPDRRAVFASLTAREYEDECAVLQQGMRYHAEVVG